MYKLSKNSKFNLYSLFITILDNHDSDNKSQFEIIIKNTNGEIINVVETNYNDLFLEVCALMDDISVIQPKNEIFLGFKDCNGKHHECFALEII